MTAVSAKKHSYMVGGVRFDVDPDYTLENAILLGEGSFGCVCKAMYRQTGQAFAVKKIKSVFDNLIDAKRTLRELRLLSHFNHENIVGIRDIMVIEDYSTFESIYIVTDLMDTDLHNICSSANVLTDDHCKYIIYQILRALKYVHSADVLHRDLKPSNVLINANSDVKICDFGLARHCGQDTNPAYTSYVATRWYRAPEIILEKGRYTKAVDVWSVGCILAEIVGRTPLFPGRDSVQQLALVTDVLGNFSAEQISKTKNARARGYMRAMPKRHGRNFADMFPHANPLALDLMAHMLVCDPDYRITVEAALTHPYLSQLHLPADEPVCLAPIDARFEEIPPTEEVLRQLIYNEMLRFHPDSHMQFRADLYMTAKMTDQEMERYGDGSGPASPTLADEDYGGAEMETD